MSAALSESSGHALLVGGFSRRGVLEASYQSAFEHLGWRVTRFDIQASLARHSRFGFFGRALNHVGGVESWLFKVNRELFVLTRSRDFDLIVVFGQTPVSAATLAQINCTPSAKLVLIWPDCLLNLRDASIAALPAYDLVACYSQAALEQVRRLGASRVAWIPLAGDPFLCGTRTAEATGAREVADISFVGNWRPEREAALKLILEQLPERSVKIWGEPDWKRRCRTQAVLRAYQGKAAYEEEFAEVVRRSKVSLNIIDVANYPAANMRFFEVLIAQGVLVSSSCPEMEPLFRHGEAVFYYRCVDELPTLLETVLGDADLRESVARCGHALVRGQHTYENRITEILKLLKVAV